MNKLENKIEKLVHEYDIWGADATNLKKELVQFITKEKQELYDKILNKDLFVGERKWCEEYVRGIIEDIQKAKQDREEI